MNLRRIGLMVTSVTSLKSAFAKMIVNVIEKKGNLEAKDGRMLMKLAGETEELAWKEKDIFSGVLKKWHPIAAGVAAVTLHTCYGALLKQYLRGASSFKNETVLVLQRAGKLEKSLVQMAVEDSVECEDGGKASVREMIQYAIIVKLLKQWIQERSKTGKEHLQRAKETETWNSMSKSKPYVHSVEEIVSFVKEVVNNFFQIPVNVSQNQVCDLVEGLEQLFRDYVTFAASCGSKQSYIPTLPPLTRCNLDSKLR